MPLTRAVHWATRELNDHLVAHADKPFAWGSHDCGLFAANAIQSFTGVDIAEDLRGNYSDAAGAFALIRKLTGGRTIADAAAWCAAKHGLIENLHPLMAQRGDLVVFKQHADDTADRLVAGIVHLNGAHLVSVGAAGLMRVSIYNVVRSWRV